MWKETLKKCSLSWLDGDFDDNDGEDDGDIDDDESDFDNGEVVWMVIFRRRNVRSISVNPKSCVFGVLKMSVIF